MTEQSAAGVLDKPAPGMLSEAIWRGDTDTAKELITLDADVNEVDPEGGCTPLILAVINDDITDNIGLVKLLIAKGADVNKKGLLGHTALGDAAKRGDEEMVLLLLDNDALINQRGLGGSTPLIWAITGGFDHIVRLLLERGVDPEMKDADGHTPMEYAVKKEGSESPQLLTDAIESIRLAAIAAAEAKANAVTEEARHALSVARQKSLKRLPKVKLKTGVAL